METPLTFEYDDVGDILYINKVPPYPEQESEQLAYNVVVRRNPRTGSVESLEVLFFTRWLFKSDVKVNGLRDLFAEPTDSAPA
jgi:hypothetical protein